MLYISFGTDVFGIGKIGDPAAEVAVELLQGGEKLLCLHRSLIMLCESGIFFLLLGANLKGVCLNLLFHSGDAFGGGSREGDFAAAPFCIFVYN